MSQGLDLVEVSSNTQPVVCRIMDFGRYKYEQSKRAREAKKHQKIIIVKEIKLRPKIGEHDYQVKLSKILHFLENPDNKVKVTLMFRGREMAHVDIGRELLNRVVGDLTEVSVVESRPKLEGRNMSMMLAPVPIVKSRDKKKKKEEETNAENKNKASGGQKV